MTTIDDLLREAYGSWDDGAVLSRVGAELQSRSRLADARRVLGRAVELVPSDIGAWLDLCFACYRSLADEDGHDALRRGIETTGSDELKATLAFFCNPDQAKALRAEIADTDDPGAQAALFSARFWQGEPAEAVAGLRKLVAEHPEHDRVRSQLLWTLLGARALGLTMRLPLHEDGLPLAEEDIQRAPDEMSSWWMKVQMLNAEEDWDGLLAATEAALERLPDEETVMLFRARAFREKGDADRAIQWFQRAIGAKPSFAGARVELGRLYEKEGKPDLAEEVFREMPTANPDYAMGPMSLALFLGRQGRWEEADQVFPEAWPRIPKMFQEGFKKSPQAEDLLARDAVKKAITT